MLTNTVYGDLITLAENGHFDVIVHGATVSALWVRELPNKSNHATLKHMRLI